MRCLFSIPVLRSAVLVSLLPICLFAVPSYSQQQPAVAAPASGTQVGATVLSSEEKAALLKQVQAAQELFNQQDFDGMMRVMSPAIFKLYNKEAFEKAGRQAMAQLKALGVKYLKTEFGEPSPLYKAGNEIICFVPRTSTIQIQGKLIKSTAYWVAVRPADGSEWKFVDGAGIQNNHALLWQMFPELQKDIQFPEWKQEAIQQ